MSFPEPFQSTKRAVLKTSNYSNLRKEVLTTYNITQSELDFLLPKNARCHEDILSNGVTCYSLDNIPPYFIRRSNPHHGQQFLQQPQQQSKQQPSTKGNEKNNKGNKNIMNDNIKATFTNPASPVPETILIPTLFALWKVPQLLPSTYVADDIFPKITIPRPTSLFTPGIFCPDLPDSFLVAGQTHPQHFLQLFPNQLQNEKLTTIVQNTIEYEFEADHQKDDPQYYVAPNTTQRQQTLYPNFFHNKSFDFVLLPSQLRAIYTQSSPYCIGVGLVELNYPTIQTFTTTSNHYISPWSSIHNAPKDSLELLYNKALHSKNNEIISNLLQTLTQFPPTPTPPEQFLNIDKIMQSTKDGHLLVYKEDKTSSTTSTSTSLQFLLETHSTLLSKYTSRTQSPSNPLTSLHSLLLSENALSQLFPKFGSKNTRDEISLQIASQLHQIPCTSLGHAIGTNYDQSADLSLFFSPKTIQDSRPYPSGHSVQMLLGANDYFSLQYKIHFPKDAFEWVNSTTCAILPQPKFITVQRCIYFLLRTAWLSCFIKPFIPITNSTSHYIITQKQVQDKLNGITNDDSDDDNTYDDDDEDIEYIDEDDEDDMNNNSHKNVKFTGPCQSCIDARFEWALRYSMTQLVTSYPLQLSELTKYIRSTSFCPSLLTHVHSKCYSNDVITITKDKKLAKLRENDDTMLIHCQCPSCTSHGTHTTINKHEQIVTNCLCVNVPIELLFNIETTGPTYSKISKLAKVADKHGWITYNQHQNVITGSNTQSCNFIKCKSIDKRAVQDFQQLQTQSKETGSRNPNTTTIGAVVQSVQGVRYTNDLKQLLHHCGNYMIPILHNKVMNTIIEKNDSKSTPTTMSLITTMVQNDQPKLNQLLSTLTLPTMAKKDNPLSNISFYLHYLYTLNIGYLSSIVAAVREYISKHELLVSVKHGNQILKMKQNIPIDDLPPIARQILEPKSNIDAPHIDQKGVYTGPVTVNANQKGQQNNNNQNQNQKGGKKGSMPTPTPTKGIYDFSDDENNDTNDDESGLNKKLTHQQIKQRDAKLKQEQQQQLKNNKKGNNNNTNNDNDDKGKVEVYLCYDALLYKALNLSNNKNYKQSELPTLINAVLTSVSTVTTSDIHTIDTLAQNGELIQYLLQTENNTLHAGQKPTTTAQTGLTLIQQEFNSIAFIKDSTRFISSLQASLQYKAASAGTKNQPVLFIFSTTLKGRLITFIVGFELFGISPIDLSDNKAFKSFMACKISLVNLSEEPDKHRLFPVTLSGHCTHMIQCQGDLDKKRFTDYATQHLNINAKDIQVVTPPQKNKKK